MLVGHLREIRREQIVTRYSYGKRQETKDEKARVYPDASWHSSVCYNGDCIFLLEKHIICSCWTAFYCIMGTHFCQNVCKEDYQTEAGN